MKILHVVGKKEAGGDVPYVTAETTDSAYETPSVRAHMEDMSVEALKRIHPGSEPDYLMWVDPEIFGHGQLLERREVNEL